MLDSHLRGKDIGGAGIDIDLQSKQQVLALANSYSINLIANSIRVNMKQSISSEVLVIKSAAQGNVIVSGYASVFGVINSHDDIVMRGAFTNISQKKDIKFLWQHDQTKPIGVITSLVEDDYGLYIESSINP